MDYLEQAKILYRKRHHHAPTISPEDHASLVMSIARMIRTCLEHQGGEASFKYLPFIKVIKTTVDQNKFQGDRAAAAFMNLEKLLLHLLSQPWKREFWLLKTYGGYFCTKVRAYLEKPEEILELVGYTKDEDDDSLLQLHNAPNAEVVLNVAFDCQVAAAECLYIGEYYDKMRIVGLSLKDAVKVMLSGSDEVVAPGTGTLPGKTMTGGNHPINSAWMSNGGRTTPTGMTQTFMAVGGMGMGIVVDHSAGSSSAAPHKVLATTAKPFNLPPPSYSAGGPPHPPNSSVPLHTQGAYNMTESVGLKVDLPPSTYGSVRTMSMTSQSAGSRASYRSSAYGSGVSGAGSVMGAPSTAFTGSSGYSSHASSSAATQNPYAFQHHTVQGNTAPFNTAPGNTDSALRPYPNTSAVLRQRNAHLPQQPAANFPYIDENDSSSGASFPEGTHEEHLRESLKNLQVASPHPMDKNKVLQPAMGNVKSSLEVLARQSEMGKQNETFVPVSYDDWEWFRKDQGSGMGVRPLNTMAGATPGQTTTTIVQRPAHLVSSDGVSRSPNVQPATAVTAMLTPDLHSPHSEVSKRHVSSLDSRQRANLGGYPPLTVVENTTIPTERFPVNYNSSGVVTLPDRALKDSFLTSNTRQLQSQPVHYPPLPSDSPFQRYSGTAQQKPSFAEIASASRGSDNSTLLSRQAMSNMLDSSFDIKNREKSSSEVVMRDKLLKMGNQRASSMTSQNNQLSPSGLSRQSSRSMDLSSLKWKCRYCTMENSSTEKICIACSRSRDAPDMQFPSAGESKRHCPTCTFENPPQNTSCDICMCILPQDVHTYV